jgi:hypothetical protein
MSFSGGNPLDQVVCYPYIEPDISWLKIAALCWERVHRVTSRHAPADSPGITELNEALNGFLLPVYPDDIIDETIVERLRVWLAARKEHKTGNSIGSFDQAVPSKQMPSGTSETEGFLLFSDKVPYPISELLLEFSAMRPRTEEIMAPWWEHELYRQRTGEWIKKKNWKPSNGTAASVQALHKKYLSKAEEWEAEGDGDTALFFKEKADVLRQRSLRPVEVETGSALVDTDVALYYLSLIASGKASQINADLFAEDSEAAKHVVTFSHVAGETRTAVLEANLPVDLNTLSSAQIADFREGTIKDRFRFQRAVQSVLNDIQSVSSESDVERLKRIAFDLATERIEETKKVYQYALIQTGIKALGTSLAPPALLSWLASALHVGLFMPAAVASTIALFGVQMLIDRDKARTEAEKSGWAYILKIQNRFQR